MLEQGFGNDAKDIVLVDLATLRSLDRAPVSALCAVQQREGLLSLTQKLLPLHQGACLQGLA